MKKSFPHVIQNVLYAAYLRMLSASLTGPGRYRTQREHRWFAWRGVSILRGLFSPVEEKRTAAPMRFWGWIGEQELRLGAAFSAP